MVGNTSYRAIDIARWIIDECNDRGIKISHLRLQSMLYFCQEETLNRTGKVLFKDEIGAWEDGAIVRTVAFRYQERGPEDMPYIKGSFPLVRLTKEEKELIYIIIVKCVKGSATEHMNDIKAKAPWRKAYKRGVASKIYIEDILDQL